MITILFRSVIYCNKNNPVKYSIINRIGCIKALTLRRVIVISIKVPIVYIFL
jgi:hypothetical protein